MIHNYQTRTAINIHLKSTNAIDHRNFIYNCILLWNECTVNHRLMTKKAFMHACKLLLFDRCIFNYDV